MQTLQGYDVNTTALTNFHAGVISEIKVFKNLSL